MEGNSGCLLISHPSLRLRSPIRAASSGSQVGLKKWVCGVWIWSQSLTSSNTGCYLTSQCVHLRNGDIRNHLANGWKELRQHLDMESDKALNVLSIGTSNSNFLSSDSLQPTDRPSDVIICHAFHSALPYANVQAAGASGFPER